MQLDMARRDDLLAKMLIVSLLGHVLFLGTQSLLAARQGAPEIRRPLKLVQESQALRQTPREDTAIHDLVQARLAQLPSPSPEAVAGGMADGRRAGKLPPSGLINLGAWGDLVGGRAMSAGAYQGLWEGAIDLTNITLAAQGNPVLLSYFGAIRAQIQQTANQGLWVAQSTRTGGVVYVGVVIAHTGAIQSLSVITDRSSSASDLQTAALDIVQSSGPFPPLPPSTAATSNVMVVTVPIEFVIGSDQ